MATTTGFASDEQIAVTLSPPTTSLDVLFGATGGLTIPMSQPGGPADLTFRGESSGVTVVVPVTVIAAPPAPTVSPSSVFPGNDIQVTGSGCPWLSSTVFTNVSFYLQQQIGQPLVASGFGGTPSVQGDWSGHLTVPENVAAGTYQLSVECNSNGDPITANYFYPRVTVTVLSTTVLSTDLNGTIVQQGGSFYPGPVITGFAPNSTITATLKSTGASLATLTVDQYGEVRNAAISIPVTAAVGVDAIVFSGGGLSVEGSIKVIPGLVDMPAPTVSPSPVEAGDTVTISGTGCRTFVGSPTTVEVYLAAFEEDNVIATAPTVAANADGTWSVSVQIPPRAQADFNTVWGLAYYAQASCHEDGAVSYAPPAGFSVTNSHFGAALSETTITQGDTVTVSVTGFGPNEQVDVTIYQPIKTIATLTTDANGDASTAVVFSADIAGPDGYFFSFRGRTSGYWAEIRATVQAVRAPAPTVSPNPAPAGSTITLQGTACIGSSYLFPTVVPIVVTSADGRRRVTGSATPDDRTGIWSASVDLAALGGGIYSVTTVCQQVVRPAAGHTASNIVVFTYPAVPLTITAVPTLSFDRNGVVAGGTVNAKVTGFAPNEPLRVTFASVAVSLGSPTTDASGADDFFVTVPAGTVPGSYPVVVSGQVSGESVTAQVSVVAKPAAPKLSKLTVSPDSAAAGGSITVSGSGCTPIAGVTALVQIDVVNASDDEGLDHTKDVAYSDAVVNADGTWSTTLTLMADAAVGSYDVLASCSPAVGDYIDYLSGFVGIGAATGLFSPSTVIAGGTTTATLTGFQPDETISASIVGGSVTASMGGNAVATLTVPSSVAAGGYQIVFTGGSSGRSVSVLLTVTTVSVSTGGSSTSTATTTAATSSVDSTTLASTGFSAAPGARLGFALIVIGLLITVGCVMLGRRTRFVRPS